MPRPAKLPGHEMRFRCPIAPLLALLIAATIVYSEILVTPPHPDKKIHVTYWEKWTGFEGDAIRQVVDAFNRSQNRIHVDLLTISGIENKTLLAVAGGDPPDVAGLYGPNVAQYADDAAVMPLDGFCRKYGISAGQYVPVYWDIGHYKGRQWALPSTPACTALHYNKAMFRVAGLDPDKPPVTIEQLDADTAKLTRIGPNGNLIQAGFLPAEPGWWNWGWGYFFGGKLWDGKSRITIDSPANIRAFTWVQSFARRYGAGAVSTFRSGLGQFSSPQNGFLDGKVAMEEQGVWMSNFIARFAPQMNSPKRIWGAVPFPYPADRPDLKDTTFADEDVLVIPRGARHPDAAFQFIRFVESQKGMEMLCGLQRKNSPLRSVSPNFYRTHPNPFIRLFTQLPYSPNVVAPPKIGIWPEYMDAINNAFDEISLLQKTPEQALHDVQVRMQARMDEYLARQRLRNLAMNGAGQ